MAGSFKGIILFSVQELLEAYKLGTLPRVLKQKLECYFRVPEEIDKGQMDDLITGAVSRLSRCSLPPGAERPDAPVMLYRAFVGTTPEECDRLELRNPQTLHREFRWVRL